MLHNLRPKNLLLAVLALALAIIAVTTRADEGLNTYKQINLVSNGPIPANHTDPNLVNAWGVVFNPNGPVWVADNGTGKSTLYDGDGNPAPPPPNGPLIVTIPTPPNSEGPSKPTGIVFNSSANFKVSKDDKSASSVFIFATEQGTLSGWAPTVDRTNAILVVDNSAAKAIYKGLALGADGQRQLLYATDFHNAKVDVFGPDFKPTTVPGGFADPGMPAGFAPFGIQTINGNIYVTYAQQDADKVDDVHGPGLGFVNVFDPKGHLIRRVASGGRLNAPWGLALAPADFGQFSGRLLVGNFGDGRISAFNLATGRPRGQLRGTDGRRLVIDGLWGLAFGNGVQNQPTNALFFTAGPNEENDGLYGRLEAVSRRDGDPDDNRN